MDAGSALLFVGIAAALAGATIWFIVAFANAEEHARICRRRLAEIERTRPMPAGDYTPWGEVVPVHPEMRAARKVAEGEGPSKGGRPFTESDIAHRREGL